MPANLHPKVFWLLIGTNDVGNKWCSPEATLLGILRVVEEIRKQKPGTMIILNSILPRSWHRNGNVLKGKGIKKGQYLPELWTAIQDINNHLSAYSDLHENIIYFDANDVFFTGTSTGEPSDEKSKQLRIDHNLMPDFLHPSAVGYKLWGDRIVAKLDELIKV
jgi:lysophospholipase L1-like esterase